MLEYTFKNMEAKSSVFGMKELNQKDSRLHTHSYIELAYIKSGECSHVLNGQHTNLHGGDYFIIDFNCAHQYFCKNDKGVELINCMFMPNFLDSSLAKCNSFKNLVSGMMINIDYDSLKFDPSHYVFNDGTGQIGAILNNMYSEYLSQEFGSVEILKYSLSQIIILTLRKILDSSVSDKTALTKTICKLIKQRFYDDNLLSRICSELHYSMPYVSMTFKKETGLTFKEYQVNTRVGYACKLLTTTDKKITHIANEVGYKSQHYFVSVFKEKTGVTPTEFRKIARIQ